MEHYTYVDYDRLAKKAIEKNIGYFLRKLSREGEHQFPISYKHRFKGVTFRKENQKYRGYVNHKKRQIHIGYFKTEKEAVAAREEYLKNNKKLKIAS